MLQRQQHRSRKAGPARAVARLTLSFGLAVAMIIAAAGIRPEHAAAAEPHDEQLFVQMINDLRASKGLPALAVHTELTAAARSWTNKMASNDQLAHSPDMSSGVSAAWSVLGENVGMHGVHDLQQLFQAFENSPAHYQNLIDPRFNYIGVGVVNTSEGALWTTHRFMAAPPAEPNPPTTKEPTATTTPTTTIVDKTTLPPTTTPAKTPKTVPTTTKSAPTTTETTSQKPVTAPQPKPTTSPKTTAPDEPTSAGEPAATDEPAQDDPKDQSGTDLEMTIVDDPTAGPSEPDVPTVEQVLVELAEAGI